MAVPTRKIQALLTYLALPPGREHTRDKLAALLWGDRSQAHARQSLRQALLVLRQAGAAVRPPFLHAKGATIALNAEAVHIDAVTFERLVRDRTPEALAQAMQWYRGDLLAGLTLQEPPFEEWLTAERERLRELALEALAKLLAAQRTAGAAEAAVQTGLRLIALDPLQEPVHRTLMRLYAELGRRGTALHQYQLCVGVLQRELGVEPEDETKRLYQEILRRRPLLTTPSERVASRRSAPFASIRRPPLVLTRDTPFIGRDQEMGRLRTALAEVIRGQGRVVALVGEAGVGKTRLVTELAAEVSAESTRVLIGHCHESEQILPFGPWVDALRAGSVGEDREWVETLPLAIRRELGRLLPELGSGDGASAAPPDYRQLFEGVGLLLRHESDGHPTVLIVEDFHWADEMSVRLLAFIGHRLPAWRVLLLVTVRAEDLVHAQVLERTFGELEREPHVSTVALGPLSRDDTVRLVQALARSGRTEQATGARLSEQVWRSSEGNPFVIIEAIRAATHDALSPGLEALPVPERVRDIIGRQLARLDERSYELVGLASVVGREFEFALLQHLAGLGEEETARTVEELIRRRVLHSVGERLDFTHDRVREVAYRRILPSRRKVLHRRVADALATLYAENLEPHHLALGLHYAEGEVWDQAVVHLRRAGVRAVERSANREALACFERALAALANTPENSFTLAQAIDLRFELRNSLHPMGELQNALGHLRDAERLARTLNDEQRLGWVSVYMSGHLWQIGETTEALACAERANVIAGTLADFSLHAAANFYIGQACFILGDYRRAEAVLRENVRALQGDPGRRLLGLAGFPSVLSGSYLAWTLAEQGDFVNGLLHGQEAVGVAEGADHRYSLILASWRLACLYTVKGELHPAVHLLERALELCRDSGLTLLSPYVKWSLGSVCALMGQVGDGLSLLHQAVEAFESAGLGAFQSLAITRLAEACALADRYDEADTHIMRAVSLARKRRERGVEAYALRALGDIEARSHPRCARATESHYREAISLAQQLGMRPLVAHCHLGLGKLYRRAGRREQAQQHLTTATTMYREMDMRLWMAQADLERKQFA